MRRRDTPLDPAVQSELDALEAALEGRAEADPQLVALAAAVREQRAVPDPGFLARLDARAAEGFPRSGARVSGFPVPDVTRRRSPRRLALAPALGCAAALLVGLTVVALNAGGDDPSTLEGAGGGSVAQLEAGADPDTPVDSAGSGGATEPAPPAAAGGASNSARQYAPPAGSVAPAPAPLADVAPGRRERKVERAADLRLRAARGDVQEVADGVVRTTLAVGGVVANSQVSSGDQSANASFTLRIPAARLDDALARLSKLAHVAALTQDSTDITGPVVSAAERLSDARAQRRALLRALGRADTQARIDSLRRRLRIVGSEIARHKGDLAALRRRADLATVSVAVDGDGRPGSGSGAGVWTPRDAAGDAVRVLEVAAGVALVGAAVLAPLLLLVVPAALVGRAVARRRRESALDAA